jgi:hypothetical protein
MSGGQHHAAALDLAAAARRAHAGLGLNWLIMKIALAEMPLWTFRSLEPWSGAQRAC